MNRLRYMSSHVKNSNFCAGECVEIRSRAEILRTLDKNGQLEGLPFMPEMLKFCGQRFRVWKRAHKACDTVNKTGGRRMGAAVHLEELRCDGEGHGGCQAGCLLYWKEAWVKPAESTEALHAVPAADSRKSEEAPAAAGCTEDDLRAGTLANAGNEQSAPVYVCQATRLPYVTTLLPWWDVRQYWEDFASGNVGLWRIVLSFTYSGYYRLTRAGIGLGRPLRWLYDAFQRLFGGVPFPNRSGTIPRGQATPVCSLNLQPGEWVRVKPYPEILATLDQSNRNRGLYFDCEEVPFCGGTYRVKGRVSRIINERTGAMMELKMESVILDGVYCQARYSDRRLFCPRSIAPMWREIWLERAESNDRKAAKAQQVGSSN